MLCVRSSGSRHALRKHCTDANCETINTGNPNEWLGLLDSSQDSYDVADLLMQAEPTNPCVAVGMAEASEGHAASH